MIHQYKNNGYNIVMDVESGSIHVVDDIVYDMIAALCDYSKAHTIAHPVDEDTVKAEPIDTLKDYLCEHLPGYEECDILDAYEEVSYLIESGSLFSEDPYEQLRGDLTKRKSVVSRCRKMCSVKGCQNGHFHSKKWFSCPKCKKNFCPLHADKYRKHRC